MNAAEKLDLAIKLLTEIRQELDQPRAVNKQKSPAVADDRTMFCSLAGQMPKETRINQPPKTGASKSTAKRK